MCLSSIRSGKNHKPYNKSNIRWKIVREHSSKLVTPFYNSHYKLGVRRKCRNQDLDYCNLEDIGFHVFVNKKDAFCYANGNGCYNVMKVIVEGFKLSGEWDVRFDSFKSETWKYITAMNVYDKKGNDITKNYISNKVTYRNSK